ncbi:MAG: DUF4834 family protein [Bacteroidales bacterium]|nr:DUF4834 family protein [Bacteroidales bacterium]
MFQILLFILLFFIVLVVAVGFKVLGGIYKLFFGSPANRANRKRQEDQRPNHWQSAEKKKEKIFSQDEGEYIDFEEIKDDKKETDK